MNSIAIFGGSGFLGSKICEIGVRLGWSVTSLSRSGKPPKPLKSYDNSWMDHVKWKKCDLSDLSTYKDYLATQHAVVHSVGLLLEDTRYKKTLTEELSLLTGLLTVLNAIKGPNPMDRSPSNTYAAIQRDSAVLLAETYLKAPMIPKDPSFVYISADSKPPIVVPDAYLATKREAEYLLAQKKGLRCIFMRPGFMYDPNDPVNARTVVGQVLNTQYEIFKKLDVLGLGNKDKFPTFNKIYRPVVTTEQVATELYKRLNNHYEGVVTLEDMRRQ